MPELKPCPFCGGEVKIVLIGGGWFWKHKGFIETFHTTCPVRWNHKYETEAEAIEAWNRRYTPEEIDFDYGAED